MKRQELIMSGVLIITFVLIIGLILLVLGDDEENNNNESPENIDSMPTASESVVNANIQPTSTLSSWNIPGIPLQQEAISEIDRIEGVMHDSGYEDASVSAAPNMGRSYQIMVSLPIDAEIGDSPEALGTEIATIVQIVTDAEIATDYFAIHFLVVGETIRWQAMLSQIRGLSGEDLFYFGGPAPTPIVFPT